VTKHWPAALIRLMVGPVFLLEGLQKFFDPALGSGRFEKIGFAAPELWANAIGGLEVTAGLLILLGLFTRPAAAVTGCIMVGALLTTKLPILLGHDLGPFVVRELPAYGFLPMAHEMRTDWAMLCGSVFLVLSGGGAWSLDERRRP